MDLDKEDVAAISSSLDDIADYVDGVAVRITLYQIRETTPAARDLAGLLVQCTAAVQAAVQHLRPPQDHERLDAAASEIVRLEDQADTIYRRAVAALVNTPGLDPILTLKWQEIYELLERAVDKCDDVRKAIEITQYKR